MNSKVWLEIQCPKCHQKIFNRLQEDGQQGEASLKNILEGCFNILKCPYCSKSLRPVGNQDSGNHSNGKQLECPECNLSVKDEQNLINHFLREHKEEKKTNSITCPICETRGLQNGLAIYKHLEMMHSDSVVLPSLTKTDEVDSQLTKRLPKVGDRIIAMWGQSKWQYFTATVKRFMKENLKYEINWDDGDTTGRIVDYFNIAKDRIPGENELGIGTIVLFSQGAYKASSTQQIGGKRWHEGVITNIYTDANGSKRYDGCHTKTGADGEYATYRDYSYEFHGLTCGDFRLRPNVFEVVDDADDNDDSFEEADIYFSYNLVDSYSAFKNHEFNDDLASDSYKANYETMCDPSNIEDYLRQQGFNVIRQIRTGQANFKETAANIKRSKIFIACISDAYVKNENTKMEFQYAKATLKKPVIPLVVGDNSYTWSMSVVGMLIAGELYIHYKDLNVVEAKNKELIANVRALVSPSGTSTTSQDPDETTDVFLSYCWRNSKKAEEANQATDVKGNMFSDPRWLKDKISQLGYKVWLDIERLNSANSDAGLFGQIAQGLINAKVVLPCISDDYSKSQNCRMEFQFALKSLNKPVVPVVVGQGNEWKESVVGALICTHDDEPIDLQDISEENVFNKQFEAISKTLQNKLGIHFDDSNNDGLSYDSSFVTVEERHEIIEESDTDSQVYDRTTGEMLHVVKRDSVQSEPILLKRMASLPFITTSSTSRAPQLGDHVICHHLEWAYYVATVVEYDSSTMMYTVDWDDNDPSGRTTAFNEIAKDIPPEIDDLGVGSIVFFQQGGYGATDGNNSGGFRYHEGEITHVEKCNDGTILISGHHTKGEEDGKWITYRYYSYEFHDELLENIRSAPTALEAMLI